MTPAKPADNAKIAVNECVSKSRASDRMRARSGISTDSGQRLSVEVFDFGIVDSRF